MKVEDFDMDLAQADEYIRKHQVDSGEKPVFHVTPPVGWMNDPNGFSVYGGNIHLFYQFYPYDTKWGPMHWGHVTSKDFVSWKYEPVALAPDAEFDGAGCFSGSAIEADGKHVLAYTGVRREKDGGGNERDVQNQCLAVGDGISYEKKGLIISGQDLPEGFSRTDFRDPKLWKEDGAYYLAAGNCNENGDGQVVLFFSSDLKEWNYQGVLAGGDGTFASTWECPDFFTLDGQSVLICSPQNLKAQKYEFHNGHNNVYFFGTYDKARHRFHTGEPHSLDYGLDFYAAQTTELPDGRRVLIAWMQSWHTNLLPEGQKWHGMMTVPRELTIRGERILQKPVRELEQYRCNEVSHQGVEITGHRSLSGIRGRIMDMTVEIMGDAFREFAIDVANNEAYTTTFTYHREKGLLETDRTYSGLRSDMVCRRLMEVEEKEGKLKLRFLMDKYSVEVFVGDGEKVSSTVIYTPMEADQVVFSCDGTAKINVVKYEIRKRQED